MRSIDIHAHHFPRTYFSAVDAGRDWHGSTLERDTEGNEFLVSGRARLPIRPVHRWSAEERVQAMDKMGVDIHVLSTAPFLYRYDAPLEVCWASCRDANDDVAELVRTHPDRFAGLALLPMQDVKASIDELERAVRKLGLKGAIIDDHVNGRTYDDPSFLPFFQVAERVGALLFLHQGSETMVQSRNPRYFLPNTIGNLVERTVSFASLVFGGVMEKFPNLTICLAHGGGYTCYGVGRLDRGWEIRPDARVNAPQPPSAYLRRFYYDCLTHSEAALRFLVDSVGADRVMLGTDWPADMGIDLPVSWIMDQASLTQDEKELILWKNQERLLGL